MTLRTNVVYFQETIASVQFITRDLMTSMHYHLTFNVNLVKLLIFILTFTLII